MSDCTVAPWSNPPGRYSGIPTGDYEMVFEWSENYKIDREAEAAERLKWQAAGNIS